MYCTKEEAHEILGRLPPSVVDAEKLAWYVGYLEGKAGLKGLLSTDEVLQ